MSQTYTDHTSLLQDLQSLLTHPPPSAQIHIQTTTFSLPSLLRVRSPYFRALLSPAWSPPTTKPNTTPAAFQDLLEYLVTGAVTLSLSPQSIRHNIQLASLAHECLCDQLEHIVIQHIQQLLCTDTFCAHIDALSFPTFIPPPPALEHLFVTFIRHNVHCLPALLKNASSTIISCIWRMLVNAHAAFGLSDTQLSIIGTSFSNLRIVEHDKLVHVTQLIQKEPVEDREVMLDLLCQVPPVAFSQTVESSRLFTQAQLVAKYRRDAFNTVRAGGAGSRNRFRVLCESSHPHAYGARLDKTVRKVEVRGNLFGDCLITFDDRSRLSGGAELAFYTHDPELGADPYAFMVGSLFPEEVVLKGCDTFWYAFSSPERCCGIQARWGWRFYAEGIEARIGDVD